MSGHSIPYFIMPVQPTPTELYRRVSPEGELRTAKRLRASKPKVKSGCITCKARRVKCDETKPQCRRCQKFGRVCDGYPEPPSGRGVAVIPIQPRIPSVSIYNPSVSIHNSEDESRYFQTFIDYSAKELSGFFDASFWTRLVLQESHIVPPIRHAVIAIGALNKSLESAPRPDLKVNVIQSIDKWHHENAVLQYLKAIQALNNYISESDSPQLRTALVACLLFVCFETFQGSYASSVQQTYGGLKILRSYYQGKPGSKPWIPPRPVGQSSSKIVMSGKISKALQSRLGCDNVSKARAIAMHLDEYLDTDDGLQTDSEGHITAIANAFVYDASVEHHEHPKAMTGTSFDKEQHRTIMALPARKRSMYSDGIANGQIREMTAEEAQHCEIMHKKVSQPSPTSDAFRKSSATSNSTATTESSNSSARKSSIFSNSSVSTPITYTPPSTGPHTPSPSYAPPSQAPPTQVPSTSTTRKRPLASRSPTPPPLHNDFAIEEILIQTFVRLDGQGLFFGMIPGIPPLIWDIHKTWHLSIPSSFPSFASAHRCWDFLQDRALQFFRRTSFNRAYAPANLDSPEQIAEELASYLNQLSAFTVAFQPILDDAISPDGLTVVNPAAVVLSLYQKITVITLAAIPSESEMVYDIFLSDFKYIVDRCALLIASHNTTQKPPNPRFTFEVGIVPPLHVTATKCRDPVVRREAVDLLFASPRQEGMWDGVLSARIGKWMTSCEEDGLELNSLNSSRQSSVSQSSSPRGSGGRFSYPSPPSLVEDVKSTGGWEDGKKISDVVNESVGKNALSEIDGNNLINTAGSSPRTGSTGGGHKKSVGKGKGKEVMRKGWAVPEENRVRLMVVDFHIPERYIKVKCQRALPGADGTREERETVIAW